MQNLQGTGKVCVCVRVCVWNDGVYVFSDHSGHYTSETELLANKEKQ